MEKLVEFETFGTKWKIIFFFYPHLCWFISK